MLSKLSRFLLLEGDAGNGASGGAGASSLLTTPSAGGGAKAAEGSGDSVAQAGAQKAAGDANSGADASKQQVNDWRASLPEELREDKILKNFQDVSSLAKSYVNASRLIGAEKISIPGKHATEDDWKQVYSKLGLPETLDKYEVKFKEGATLDAKFADAFKEVAHKSGILPGQAQKLADWFSEANGKAEETFAAEQAAKRDADVGKLKKEWGVAFEPNLRKAQKVLGKYADEETLAYLDKTGLGNDVTLIKLLAKVGDVFKEDSEVDAGSTSKALTPKDALQAATKIIGDMTHPYHNKNHPNHKAAVAEVAEFYQMAFPKSK